MRLNCSFNFIKSGTALIISVLNCKNALKFKLELINFVLIFVSLVCFPLVLSVGWQESMKALIEVESDLSERLAKEYR